MIYVVSNIVVTAFNTPIRLVKFSRSPQGYNNSVQYLSTSKTLNFVSLFFLLMRMENAVPFIVYRIGQITPPSHKFNQVRVRIFKKNSESNDLY